jgi:hypothetical protein
MTSPGARAATSAVAIAAVAVSLIATSTPLPSSLPMSRGFMVTGDCQFPNTARHFRTLQTAATSSSWVEQAWYAAGRGRGGYW